MSDGSPPSAGSVEDVATRLVRSWARLTTRVWRNVLDLYKAPLEMRAKEDTALRVWSTTVFFPSTGTESIRLRCTSITRLPSTTPISVDLTLDPTEYSGTAAAQMITVAIPRRAGPGIYRFILEDEGSRSTKLFTLPFGVPERSS
jgi:hypothetical protein